VIDSTLDGQTPTRKAAPGPEEKTEARSQLPGAQRPSPTPLPALWFVLDRGGQHVTAIHDSLAALQ
jgi:hypothetical protein